MNKLGYSEAITRQPKELDVARDRAVSDIRGLPALDRAATVGVIGIGASYCAALAGRDGLRSAGIRAIAIDAGELWDHPDPHLCDLYIAVSASGQSLETVEVVRKLRAASFDARIVTVTVGRDNPLAELGHAHIVCGGGEDSIPATTSFVASLQALGLLIGAWSGEADNVAAAWAEVPHQLEAFLGERASTAKALADRLAAVTAIDIVSAGASAGAAAEGVLLFREAPRFVAAWFDSRAYLHGPMEVLQAGRALIGVGNFGKPDASSILGQAVAAGCPTVHVGSEGAGSDGVHRVGTSPSRAPLAETVQQSVALQLISSNCAERLGLTSGTFRYPQPQVKLRADQHQFNSSGPDR
ncbi:MAG: SIS domain-containing protein [Acidimicrobiales bacterium]